jgi:hypothetical protein
MISGAGSSSLVAGILFMLWKRNTKDWERTNCKLDKAINRLNDSIQSLSNSVTSLRVEVAKSSVMNEAIRENMKKIEARVFK